MSRLSARLRLWLLTSLALVALVGGSVTNLWLWPVTYLGYTADLTTGQVIAVEPGGSAAQAGLLVGDQITQIYGLPYSRVLDQWNVLSLLAPENGPVPMVITRRGIAVTLQLARGQPPTAFQLAKASTLVLAVICWITGWLLGLVRRHEAGASLSVAVFWLAMSSTLGMYQFARFASVPLLAIVQWLLVAILAPLGVAVHLRFPARPIAGRTLHRARVALYGAWLVGTALFIGALSVARMPLPQLVVAAGRLLPLVFCLAFVGSGALLYRAYRQTQTTHVRRQIRLITAACLCVGGAWLVLLVVPVIQGTLPPLAGVGQDLLAGLIPLAYLGSGVLPNLSHLDRLVRRGSALLTTTVLLALLLIATGTLLPPGWRIVGLTSVCILSYRPLAALAGRIFANRDRSYLPLHRATHRLTTSLDTNTLAEICLRGVRATFHQPRCGLYLADPESPGVLRQVLQMDASDLPAMLDAGPLVAALAERPGIYETRTLHARLQSADLRPAEIELLHAPDIALWGVLRQAQEPLLGFIVLGSDRGLDPYQVEDLGEIQRFIDAAALAFTNSATYQQTRVAEAVIRDLYHEMQRVQDVTTTDLARVLHDEIINVIVRLNIQSIRKVLPQISDPALRDELQTLLAGEELIAEGIRVICERLHPSGLDDPMGLPNLLRLQTQHVETMWPGECYLRVQGEVLPLTREQQHEAVRIVREGLTNVVKHADATRIGVTLRYPDQTDGVIVITVDDDGRSGAVIRPRPGHRGLWGMQESARAAGGELSFTPRTQGGTCLTFRFRPWPLESVRARPGDGQESMGESYSEHAL